MEDGVEPSRKSLSVDYYGLPDCKLKHLVTNSFSRLVLMNSKILRTENRAFVDTAGINENNAKSGFKPAFFHEKSGKVEISRLANGQLAPIHIVDWLPKVWAISFHEDGRVKCLASGVVAGFVRDTIFYTRKEVADLIG